MADVTVSRSCTFSLSGIVKHFESLPDPRHTRNRRHLLVDVIVVAVCGVIVGCPAVCHNILDFSARVLATWSLRRENMVLSQQFPLAGTTALARVPFSPSVSSQADFRFRSPAIRVNIGSLHRLRVPERSFARRQPASEPSLVL